MSAVCGYVVNIVRCVFYGATNQTKKEQWRVWILLRESEAMQKAVFYALWRAQPTWTGIITTFPLYPLTTPRTCNRKQRLTGRESGSGRHTSESEDPEIQPPTGVV